MKRSTLVAASEALRETTDVRFSLDFEELTRREAALLVLGLLEVEKKYGKKLSPEILESLEALGDKFGAVLGNGATV